MKSRLFAFGLLILSAVLAACGGGGGGGGGTPPVNPTPVSSGPTAPPIPSGAQYSYSVQRNVPQPTPAAGGQSAGPIALALPNGSGAVGGSVNLPGQYAVIGSGETASIILTNRLPQGMRALPQSAKAPVTPIVYIGLQFSPNPIALEAPPSFTLTIPSADVLPSADYWIAGYDPTQSGLGWQMAFEGPQPGATTLKFNGSGLFDFARGSNATYWFALYVASSASAQPTPAPTTAPVSFGCTNQPFDISRRTESFGAPRPLASGDTWSYGGSNSALTQTMARSAPCPEPTSTAVAAVSDSVTILPTTAPDNTAQWDMRSNESDAFPTSTVTTTTDATVGETASREFIYGSTVTDALGNTSSTSYTTRQTLVELPETLGNSWSINPAGSTHESLVDGSEIQRTISSDGSYIEFDTTPTGGQANITEGGSGAGTYTISGLGGLSFAAPSNGIIAITITGAQGQTLDIPAWFSAPLTLYTDTSQDQGAVSSLPVWCTPGVSVPTAEQIEETVSLTDPVLGYTEQRNVTTYDSPTYGTVCLSIVDTENEYYDYMLDTPFLLFVSGNGSANQVNTIAENYVMNSNPVINARVRGNARTRRRESQGFSPEFVRAHVAAIEAIRTTQRAQRAELLRNYLQRAMRKGGVR